MFSEVTKFDVFELISDSKVGFRTFYICWVLTFRLFLKDPDQALFFPPSATPLSRELNIMLTIGPLGVVGSGMGIFLIVGH